MVDLHAATVAAALEVARTTAEMIARWNDYIGATTDAERARASEAVNRAVEAQLNARSAYLAAWCVAGEARDERGG